MGHFRSLQARALCSVVGIVAAAGCMTKSPTTDAPPVETDTGNGGDGGSDNLDDLRLDLEASVLEPGESTLVTVKVTPPRETAVQLALVDGASDAFLEHSTLLTDEDGTASTRLTVVARTRDRLELLARTAQHSARRLIELREPSVADLAVVPLYAGGRSFAAWDILLAPELNCDLGYESDAWESATRLPRQASPDGGVPVYELTDVSARHPLTVIIKAEKYAYGCVRGVLLTPKTRNRVDVPINQRLADVANLDFEFRMNIAPESEFWGSLMGARDSGSYLAGLAAAFRGSAASDLTALLDAMQALADNPNPTAFETARRTANWDSTLSAKLSPEGARNGLSSRVQRWLQAGATLLQAPDAIAARLTFDDQSKRGHVELTSVADMCPETCWMKASQVASVTADAQDVLRVGFDLVFLPSPLMTCLADRAAASASDAGEANVLSALGADFDCDLVASWMVNEQRVLFDGCDVGCGASLCRGALAELWQRVVGHDLGTTSLEVNAAGRAELTPSALVAGVTADWVGTTSLLGVETSVAGQLRSTDEVTSACR